MIIALAIILYLFVGLFDMTARQISFIGSDRSVVSAMNVGVFILVCAALWPVRLMLTAWRRMA